MAIVERLLDAGAGALALLALAGAVGMFSGEGVLGALGATSVFGSSAWLTLLAAVGFLAGKYWLNREIEHERILGIAHQARPYYETLDPDDPMVKRLIQDRIAEKASFQEADIIDVTDEVLSTAVFLGASDVHVQAKAKQVRLSYRIDGILTDIAELPKEVHGALVNRIKIMSQLDISKSDTPQDGRIQSQIRGRTHNMRVSVFPTLHGQTVVIRILGGKARLYSLDEFGIQTPVLEGFKRILHQPQGVVLFTGPTGSGKTSLMYGALREILTGEKARRNICTLEDPIEQTLDDINQSQIEAKKGVTFAAGLRALLRQDPDVIMVGEIRDLETAQVAIQAGQTGHLILSTVHANSAAGAFARLMDMGVEPFLLASTVTGVVAQRLVRRLCPGCCGGHRADPEVVKSIGGYLPEELACYVGEGCEECNQTGFRGRLAIFEFMKMSDAISEAVMKKATVQDLVRAARKEGMLSLFEDGLIKVGRGQTSLDEMVRVVAS